MNEIAIESNIVKRSTRFDLIAPDDKYREIIASIRLYRAMCRKAFAACAMAEIGGATISQKNGGFSLKPDTDASKKILAAAFDKEGKVHLYQLRDFILYGEVPKLEGTDIPTWAPFVWDQLRIIVSSTWKARDPSIGLTKGYLVMQGARGLSLFQNRGIGIPSQQKPEISEHTLRLKWDKQIGGIDFKLGRLDGGRYHVWKCLRDKIEGWKLGTLYLSENDGKICVTICYERPAKIIEGEGKAMELAFGNEVDSFIGISGFGKKVSFSVAGVAASLEQIKIRKGKWEERAKADRRMQTWKGRRSKDTPAMTVLKNNTIKRENFIKDINHVWTRKIIETAKQKGCIEISVENIPSDFFGEPWQWAQFKLFLEYKASECGIKIIYK
jgi:transposase